MAVTVAEGVVKVTADGKAVADDLKSSLDEAGGKAESSGRGFGSKLLGGVGKVFKAGAIGIGVAAGAGIGVALTKGFSRLNAIDQAKAKLEGLGNSTQQIDQIMTNALASVKGTAFGLDEAGTTAASAVAAGIKPGAELEGVLKTIADTATIAGASMSDTGAIFNSVAARGKLQGDDLMQLQERGVPVLAFLAKHYGVTAAAASDMVSKGEVDFANFSAAMQENLGGAALSSGKTFSGAMANLMASFGRIGAGLIGGIFPHIAPALSAITTALGPVEGAAGAIGDKIGSVVGPAIDNFVKGLSSVGKVIGPIFTSIGAVAGPIFAQLAQSFGPLIPLVVQLATSFSPLGIALKALSGVMPQLIPIFTLVADIIAGALGTALRAIVPLVSQLANVFSSTLATALPVIAPLIGSLAIVFVSLVGAAQKVVMAIFPLVTTLIGQLAPIVMQLITSILPPLTSIFIMIAQAITPLVQGLLTQLMPTLQSLVPVITTVFAAIVPIIQAAMQIIQGVIQVVTGLITGNWSQAWAGIQNIVSGVAGAIMAIISGFLNILLGRVSGGLESVRATFTAIWTAITGALGNAVLAIVAVVVNGMAVIKIGISAALNFAKAIFVGAWNVMRAGVAAAVGGIVSAVISMASGIGSGIATAVAFFTSLPGKIRGALGDAGSWLVGVGRNIIAGLVNGIKGALGFVTDAARNVAQSAVNAAKAALGIHSPSRVFAQIGGYIGEGLQRGIANSSDGVQTAARKMAQATWDAFSSGEIGQGQLNSILGTINSGNDQMVALVNRRVGIVARIADANKKLKAAVTQRDKYRDTVTQGLSKFDASSFGTPTQIIESLKQRVADTKTFTSVMSKLRKAGMDSATFQQFISAGTDALPLAQQLLAGGSSGIRQIASLQGQLSSASSKFAASAADGLYGAGVNAAKGLVAGLQSQQTALERQMRKLSGAMVTAIKSALGIHSPSRVFRDQVGAMMGQGVAVGFAGQTPHMVNAVRSSLAQTVQAAKIGAPNVARVVAGNGAPVPVMAGGGGGVRDINVYEATDPLGTTGRIRKELDKYGRM